MIANRLRYGALLWLLTLQFFVVETIAQLRWPGPYSRLDQVVSDLGTALSPARSLMNASFVVQAALILGGTLLLAPALRSTAGTVARVLLAVAAAGVLLVGVFPSDGNATLHAVGAVAHLLGGCLAVIALAYAVRRRSEAVGTTLALLGLVGTGLTIFFFTGVVEWLGEGGTERVGAYVIPIGLALAGMALWRFGADDAADPRRAAKEQERAERAEQARRRDEALEAAAARQAAERRTADPADPAAAGEPDDPEDLWAATEREDRR
ncbi:DUF998 domain-containing protein [Geodermatophilus sp. SYSU D00815]